MQKEGKRRAVIAEKHNVMVQLRLSQDTWYLRYFANTAMNVKASQQETALNTEATSYIAPVNSHIFSSIHLISSI
jgi:hypothetical protein